MFAYVLFPMVVYFPLWIYKTFFSDYPIPCTYYHIKHSDTDKLNEVIVSHYMRKHFFRNQTVDFMKHMSVYVDKDTYKTFEYDEVMHSISIRIYTPSTESVIAVLNEDAALSCTCEEYMNLSESDSESDSDLPQKILSSDTNSDHDFIDATHDNVEKTVEDIIDRAIKQAAENSEEVSRHTKVE